MKAMKVLALNYITFVVVVMSMAGLYSCSTDYMAYDVELKMVFILHGSFNYQFGMQKGEDFAYDMTVRVLGTPKDHDRVFGVELVADETTAKEGLHYELSKSFIIPANKIIGKISFVLHRYLDPEITQHPFVIKMKLVENDDFRLVMGNECKLEFSDTELPRPRWWSETFWILIPRC